MAEPTTYGGTRVVVAARTARRAARSGAVWGLLFGALVANEALSYHRGFPTAAARAQFARSFGSNGGLTAVTGPARRLGTIEGFVSWRMLGLMIVVGAVWGLLTATRLLRGEEDAGRWDLLLVGPTGRGRATAEGLLGLAAGWGLLWALTAVPTVLAGSRSSVGFSVGGSLLYATTGTASAAMFLAVGALCSQLGSTRRGADAWGAGILGLAYAVRMVADSDTSLGWLRWCSPLGWVENVAPLTGPQPLALVPVALVVVLAGAAAVLLAGRRDVGVGTLVRRRTPATRTRWLDGPVGLAVRLERGVVLAWVGGLTTLALVFGLVAHAASVGHLGDSAVGQVVGRHATRSDLATAWIGYELLYLAALLAFAAAVQVAALRREESDGALDNLLARRVGRGVWLGGRLLVGVLLVGCGGLGVAVGGWLGLGGSRPSLGTMLLAGLNTAVPGLLVLGFGSLAFGLVPRLAAPLLYAAVLWSFLVEIVGPTLTDATWLLQTSVLARLGPVPATSLSWPAVSWAIVLALTAGVAGMLVFDRRDLVGA